MCDGRAPDEPLAVIRHLSEVASLLCLKWSYGQLVLVPMVRNP
jgi:hypothetical protein